MKKDFPQFTYTWKNGIYIFHGKLKPTINSPDYTVRIEYRGKRRPNVFILDPKIEDNAPHRFPIDKSLCLYHSSEYRWNEFCSLTDTIVPWTCAWLYFYEVWKETGIWYGEEYPHLAEKKKED
jgi:hypothetical protein